MWKYRHSVKDNPKSGYDWSATGQRQTAFCVCQPETENVEDLLFSQEDNPKTHRLNREISCETGIHLLTVHIIIYRDLQLNCVKRPRAQQLSDSLQAAAVRGTVWLIWFRDEKCLPTNHHSTRRTIGFIHQLITRSDTLIPAVCYACRLWCPLPWHKWVCVNWYLSPWGEGERPVLLRCFAVWADTFSNQTCRRTLFIHKTICWFRRNWSFFVFCDFPR